MFDISKILFAMPSYFVSSPRPLQLGKGLSLTDGGSTLKKYVLPPSTETLAIGPIGQGVT